MNNFGQEIFSCIINIPKGKVVSYGQVAAMCGKLNGAREVGRILKNLDINENYKIPWWRVVNNKGEISIKGNWTASKELQAKFLKQESVKVSRDFKIDMKKYRYPSCLPIRANR